MSSRASFQPNQMLHNSESPWVASVTTAALSLTEALAHVQPHAASEAVSKFLVSTNVQV